MSTLKTKSVTLQNTTASNQCLCVLNETCVYQIFPCGYIMYCNMCAYILTVYLAGFNSLVAIP